MRLTTTTVLCLMGVQAVHAHMQLVLPPAINSKSDPQTAEANMHVPSPRCILSDYSMTAPLNKDGSNFPAKKYATKAKLDSLKPVATLVAGKEFTWGLGGTATHNGGSCQVAISYDMMETMVVIASWVGGCPLSHPYKFKVPDIPGCDKCFFIWDWFNKSGNREMYQNAAVVSISGTAKQFVGPQIFRANTFGDDVCETIEGDEIHFPEPGDQVFYGAGLSASSPVTEVDCPGWDNKKIVTVTGPGNGPKATAPVGGASGSSTGATGKTGIELSGPPTKTGTTAAKPTGTADGSSASSGTEDPEPPAKTGAGDSATPTSTGAGNERTFLLLAGGFVALVVLAIVFFCLFHRPIAAFVDSLGEIVTSGPSEPARRPPSRPSTPGPAAQPDIEKVRRSLHELWVTEESYLRKITSLLQDYAQPLRTFSKKRETAIIPAFEATHLFTNIEQLVPISVAFEKDLKDVAQRAQNERQRVPEGFGEVILAHVEQMAPYKKWLANVSASEAIRRELDKHNSSFREFVERTQIHSRESANATGGFKEFLAEPFQRVSRYRLMIDPIIQHLEPGDPNIEPLQIASTILSDICSMEVDGATQRAAMFWSLKETIDGFPDSLVDFERRLIATIDADEVIEVTDSRPTTLRCTLFLFQDKLLIAKRPSGDKQGKVHAGVDDLDRTVALYQTSHLSPSQASILGSPKKLRKGVLGFRGIVDVAATTAIDLGERSSHHEFGLVFDHPPDNHDADIIENGRITAAVASIASSYGIDSFPATKPLSPGSGRSRTRSNLLSVLDVFSSGGNSLKRGNSLISKSSSTATTTFDTPSLSGPSQRLQSAPPARRPLNKHSAPDLSRSVGASAATDARDFGSREQLGRGDQAGFLQVGGSSRSRPRRSMSLPPPPSDLRSSPGPLAAFEDAPSPAETTGGDFPEVDCDAEMDRQQEETPTARQQATAMLHTSPMAYRPQPISPHRRMMGPREMRGAESADESPQHLPLARNGSPSPIRRGPRQESEFDQMHFEPADEPPRSGSSNALSKRARPKVEPSPRPSPAKKMASRLSTDAALSADVRAAGRELFAAPSGPAEVRTSQRIPDVFSPPRGSSTNGLAPSAAAAKFEEDEPMLDVATHPFDQLRKHVDDMRLKLARELTTANKENERIVSPTALTRSPQTRNVFGKAIPANNVLDSPAARFSKAASVFSDGAELRPRLKIDFTALSEWTRRLADLIDTCEVNAKAAEAGRDSPKDEGGSTKLEMAMLEQERDLIAAELAALKDEMTSLQQASRNTELAFSATQEENAKLRQAYMDICGEADALHADFNAALESVHLAAQAEPSATGEYIELTAQLSQAVAARFDAEHQLRLYRRAVQAELEEKAHWAVLLRQHGLIA
ncbi:hypothetical protein B0A53_00992 [Rhodotorula sp. CCFEE 5036]|nr:hypothetical protein B0A53_00992 [Rhodotorula sp. CCFEE 5036]